MQDPALFRELQEVYREAEKPYGRFWSRRITPRDRFKLNLLIARVAQVLLRFSTYPEEHGIASTVFLGTPFYYKQWRSDWRLRALDRIWNALGEALLWGLAAYALLLIGSALVSALSPLSWLGFNPLRWHVYVTSVLGLGIAAGAVLGWRRASGSANTNVYFDETMFLREAGSSPLTELEGRTLFDALVVSSGYLDEAFAGLSSFPVVGTLAPRVADGMLKPKPWTFVAVPWEIGRFRLGIGGLLRRSIQTLARRIIATIKFLAYPARAATYTLVTRPLLMSQAARLALPLSYGLPDEEFLAGRIVVRQELDVPQIASRQRDVARDLLDAPVSADIDKRRFDFLWDEGVLAERFARSQAAAHFHSEPTADVKRHVLAIEERLREFFGVAGLRHSLYYENDAVLDAVVRYLLHGEA
jgi:hypothetical protein